MLLSVRASLAALLAALVPHVAAAQRLSTSLDVGITRIRWEGDETGTATSLTPAVSLRLGALGLDGQGTFSLLADGVWTGQGGVAASVFTPAYGPLHGEVAADVGGSVHEDGLRTGQARLVARAHLPGRSRGLWLGGGGGRTDDGLDARALALAELGGWLTVAGATLVATVAPTRVAGGDGEPLRYTDVTATGSWERGRLQVGVSGGARAGDGAEGTLARSTGWGSASLGVRLAGPVSLVVAAGSYPVDPTQGFPGGRFASLALRVARSSTVGGASGAAASPAESDAPHATVRVLGEDGARRLVELAIRAPGAGRVEVMGDPTGWAPHALSRGPDGLWRLRARLRAGAYQVMIRADDGAWAPPAGLPVVSDEGGRAGLLVVP